MLALYHNAIMAKNSNESNSFYLSHHVISSRKARDRVDLDIGWYYYNYNAHALRWKIECLIILFKLCRGNFCSWWQWPAFGHIAHLGSRFQGVFWDVYQLFSWSRWWCRSASFYWFRQKFWFIWRQSTNSIYQKRWPHSCLSFKLLQHMVMP